MDLVFKSGQTMPSMKVNGAKTKLTAEESSGMPTVTFMKVNGKTTRPTDTVFIFTSMAPNMRATGRTISRTDKEWRAGKMEVATKVATKKA